MAELYIAIAKYFMDGTLYFVSLYLVLAALFLRVACRSHRGQLAARILLIVSLVFIFLSSTQSISLLLWLFAVAATFLGTFQTLEEKLAPMMCLFLLGFTLIASESLHRDMPNLYHHDCERLHVIGDSLGKGAELPSRCWPELLGEELNLPVTNTSTEEGNVNEALQQARNIGDGRVLVILATGSRDLAHWNLDFEQDLRRLLEETCKPDRRVVMLELPLPPFHNHYGVAQRRLSEEFGVQLVPKRLLASVITTPGATADGPHLTNAGHWQLASALSELFVYRSPRDQTQGGVSGR